MATANKDPKTSTPLIPAKDATYTIHATTRINAPAALVFRTVRNTETWKDWNKHIPRVDIKVQPPEDNATDAEFAELVVLNTSRALSVHSDYAEGGIMGPPVGSAAAAARRASHASGMRDSNGPSAAQRFAEAQKERRGSLASNYSTSSGTGAQPSTAEQLFAQPASGGGGLTLAPPASTSKSRKSSQAAAKRRLSMNAIFGEPSVRLIVGTTMMLHTRRELPKHPSVYKDFACIVTEVSRPDDPTNPEDTLSRSKTHTTSPSGVYRIVWGSDNTSALPSSSGGTYPKFMLQFQRVTEIRPVFRGDGKEESEISMWEAWKGISVKDKERPYMQQWAMENAVLGIKEFCESFGGAVDRRDFSEG